MRDFTLAAYRELLQTCLIDHSCKPVREYDTNDSNQVVYLRHDVDRKPGKALQMAKLEHDLDVRSTYFFRCTSECFVPDLIKEIESMGHEIGYHYENLSTAAQRLGVKRGELKEISAFFAQALKVAMQTSPDSKQPRSRFEELHLSMDSMLQNTTSKLMDAALADFQRNLERLRRLANVTSIAMHGMPFLPIDNRILWLKYNYQDFGIQREPYFDIDYNQVLYITDAGRTWFDPIANQRDKVETDFSVTFNSIGQIQEAIQSGNLPSKLLFNVHPEHWTDALAEWHKIAAIR
ncbi:MAG: hypothetical protein CVU48_06980, partial [Candidatus Cloacimonetes bacterium HGW-Cloacimonetes-1]